MTPTPSPAPAPAPAPAPEPKKPDATPTPKPPEALKVTLVTTEDGKDVEETHELEALLV